MVYQDELDFRANHLQGLVLIKHPTQFISRSYKTALHGNDSNALRELPFPSEFVGLSDRLPQSNSESQLNHKRETSCSQNTAVPNKTLKSTRAAGDYTHEVR